MSDSDDFVSDLLDRSHTEVGLADNKVSIILAGTLAAGGAIAAGLIAIKWSPVHARVGTQIFGWAGAAAGLAAIGTLGLAIYPRGRSRHGVTNVIGYFGDVVSLPTVQALRELLADPAVSRRAAEVDQLWQVSHIVARKYALLRYSLRLIAASVILLLIAAIVNIV